MAGTSVAAAAAARAALGDRGGSRGSVKEWAAVLAEVPLFATLSGRHLRRVATLAHLRRFERGVPVVVAGRSGDAFYVVIDGELSVGVPGRRRMRVGPGDYFGEMALLDGSPRSATVTAESEVLLLELGRTAFARLLKQEPAITLALLKGLAARVRDSEAANR
jgi:CRP/FNR family transcriptional regulator, cyclic AMP receptor protein